MALGIQNIKGNKWDTEGYFSYGIIDKTRRNCK